MVPTGQPPQPPLRRLLPSTRATPGHWSEGAVELPDLRLSFARPQAGHKLTAPPKPSKGRGKLNACAHSARYSSSPSTAYPIPSAPSCGKERPWSRSATSLSVRTSNTCTPCGNTSTSEEWKPRLQRYIPVGRAVQGVTLNQKPAMSVQHYTTRGRRLALRPATTRLCHAHEYYEGSDPFRPLKAQAGVEVIALDEEPAEEPSVMRRESRCTHRWTTANLPQAENADPCRQSEEYYRQSNQDVHYYWVNASRSVISPRPAVVHSHLGHEARFAFCTGA